MLCGCKRNHTKVKQFQVNQDRTDSKKETKQGQDSEENKPVMVVPNDVNLENVDYDELDSIQQYTLLWENV